MEGVTMNFTVDIRNRELVIGKIDKGQKKILHFHPDEALRLIELLRKEENAIQELAREERHGKKMEQS